MAKYKRKSDGALFDARPTTATAFVAGDGKNEPKREVREFVEAYGGGVTLTPGHMIVTPVDEKGNQIGLPVCPSEEAFAEQYDPVDTPPVAEKKAAKKAEEQPS